MKDDRLMVWGKGTEEKTGRRKNLESSTRQVALSANEKRGGAEQIALVEIAGNTIEYHKRSFLDISTCTALEHTLVENMSRTLRFSSHREICV